MSPKRLILLANPASIKADGRPVGGRPAYTIADVGFVFCDASSAELSAFAYRWGGWDSEYEPVLTRLFDFAERKIKKDREKLFRLCALVLREERAKQTDLSRGLWMGCNDRNFRKTWKKPHAVLLQLMEDWCRGCERKAWRRLIDVEE